MSQIGQLYGKLRHLHFCPLILFSLLWGGEAKMCLNVPFLGVGVSWKRECGGLRIWGMIKEKTLSGNDTRKFYWVTDRFARRGVGEVPHVGACSEALAPRGCYSEGGARKGSQGTGRGASGMSLSIITQSPWVRDLQRSGVGWGPFMACTRG